MQTWKNWILSPSIHFSLDSKKTHEHDELTLGFCVEDVGSPTVVKKVLRQCGTIVLSKVIWHTDTGKNRAGVLLLKGDEKTVLAAPKGAKNFFVLNIDPSQLGVSGASFSLGMQAAGALLADAEVFQTKPHLVFKAGLAKLSDDAKVSFLCGMLMRSASFKHLRSAPKQLSVCFSAAQVSKEILQRAFELAKSMLLTKSLVHMPANVLNPETYEKLVQSYVTELRKSHNNQVSLEVIDAKDLQKMGCGLVCAVGAGAHHPPRIFKLVYKPGKKVSKKVSLVGKGITYDTGGLDIKTGGFMRNMKKDMGGSAAAIGIFMQAVQANLDIELTCYLAVAENSVSALSMRPGDVYTARNGLTVEIDNTDAEGRLVLADALCLAAESKPDLIIDLATLTGAARTALGPNVDAMFSNSPQFATDLLMQSNETGDFVWPQPLVSSYKGLLDSSAADMVNSASSPKAGAITAALFLQKFVGQTPWIHLDTYMWCDAPHDFNHEAGGTAKCVRLVSAFLGEIDYDVSRKNWTRV